MVRSVLIAEAVARLGVSRRTVYYWIKRGRLETVRTAAGGSQRVTVESIGRALRFKRYRRPRKRANPK
jgi:excisionase family DNA binding protein